MDPIGPGATPVVEDKPRISAGKNSGRSWEDILVAGILVAILSAIVWQVIAVFFKLGGLMTCSWWWVFAPALALGGIFVLMCAIIGFSFLVNPPCPFK